MNVQGSSHTHAEHQPSYYYLYGRRPSYTSRPTLYRADFQSRRDQEFLPASPPSALDQGPQTMEQLIEQGYLAVPRLAPEMAMIEDKRHASWLGLDDLVGQIRQRENIYKQNMLELQWCECYAFNDLARGGWPPLDEQVETYGRRMAELATEQRSERVSAWRDISKIRQLLPESVQLYLGAYRKSQLLDDLEGDLL